MDVNTKGRKIHMGPRGGLYVLEGTRKIYKFKRATAPPRAPVQFGNLPNNLLLKIAEHSGKNVGRLNVALVGSRARNVIKNQVLHERSKKIKQDRKLILDFLRKHRTSNKNYHGRGHFDTTMPGVYKNKNWRYFYKKTHYDPRQEMYTDIVLFYNNKNSNPVFIHPVTGVRKPVKDEIKYLGNMDINTLEKRLQKRSKYNYWPKFVKKASRYMKGV